jgi:hypothetical protein
MKLLRSVVIAVALTGASVLTALGAPAPAEHGATVTKDVPCFASQPPLPALFTLRSHTIVNPSLRAQTICHFDTSQQPQTTRVQDFPCFTVIGTATDSRLQLSRGGQGVLSCQVKLHAAAGTAAQPSDASRPNRAAFNAGQPTTTTLPALHSNNGLHLAIEGSRAGSHGQHLGVSANTLRRTAM